MILQVMVAYDAKAKAYCFPFFVSTRELGVRAFEQAVNTPGHQLCDHSQDFTLYHLGTWNDDTGLFEVGQPGYCCRGDQFKKGVSDVQAKVA